MKVVITGIGVPGDVLPTIAIGWELTRRGIAVTFVGNPYYAERATGAGLSFMPVGTIAGQKNFMADADLFDVTKKSNEQILQEHYFPHLEENYQAYTQACHPAPSVVIGAGEIMSRSAAEKLGVPYVLVGCSPMTSMFYSRYDPPHPERSLPLGARWLAASGKRLALYYRMRRLARRIASSRGAPPAGLADDHPIVRLRTSVGLPRLPKVAPRRILCLWPEWFAPPQIDWPKQAAIAGFPLWPRPSSGSSDSQAASPATRPIVVTTGSTAAGQHGFYEAAVAACKALRRPAILVTPHKDHIPRDLPADIVHLEFAPFNELLGRAALLLHHGGIGSASYALAAGIPQIIMPMRGDQFDNANRLARLGVAVVLPGREVRAARLARLIGRLLDSERFTARCRHWQSRTDIEEGLRRAADAIEEIGRPSG